MPDWSYYPLFKPWLSRLPGNAGREFIHRGMSTVAKIPGGKPFIEFLGHLSASEKLSRNLFGLEFESPVGLSGKIDPQLSGIHAFPQLGFGVIEIGPVTATSCRPETTAFHSESDAALFLPEKAESIGLDATIGKLKKLKNHRTPLMVRLGEPAKITDDLKDYGDVFVVDFNSIHGIQELSSIKAILQKKPILLAVKHTEVAENLSEITTLSEIADGIVIDEDSIYAEGKLKIPLRQTEGMLQALNLLKEETNVPLITSGGIVEPADALALISAGAELVLLSGGYVASGPGLPKRIHEALLDTMTDLPENIPGWRWYWLFGLLILLGGAIILFFSFTKVILFYDEAFMQMTRLELIASSPSLYKFMSHDRMTLAGTMISGGFIYMQLARHGIRYGIHWTRKAFNIAAIAGFLGILLFLGFGYFDWLHGLFWLILLPFYILGYRKTRTANQSPASKNRTNHAAWKKAVYGQLLFVILGFSFVLGGVVISTIGATQVFVETDLQYICMTPDQMYELNEKLIPVIAHDRAGFGSALFSVGLLVLMLALWGFQEGAAWIWRTFLFGGIPAFSTGIFTHLYIGYTDFIHLLPAYFAFALYIGGLLLTKDFFIKRTF
ncbi:dihydroorotate dehydrogenase [Mesobacillus subterraneus]|uniref:dihydroorotate dehydrogenase n=1 Tax=Mesobacillus subterraneus TaxID=285983 RepID=UPI0020408731|nr:dihydroorotate dehydrogenase [Mesobacillus subterraneus]MCM3662824.1 dihydroorotate dehydrogenase [Mesobacillus subterraneus]MCM3683000.1 dihydroorotate dehydrogenase [Mesobacillus subterraneus]